MFFLSAMNVLLIMSHLSQTEGGAVAVRGHRRSDESIFINKLLGGFFGKELREVNRSSMPHPFINTGETLKSTWKSS